MKASSCIGCFVVAMAASGCAHQEARGSVVNEANLPPPMVSPTVADGQRALEGRIPLPKDAQLASRDAWKEVYRIDLPYRDAVGFYDRALASSGFADHRKNATGGFTTYAVLCADGETAQVEVQATQPITIEVKETGPVTPPLPKGVTEAMPANVTTN